MTHPFRLSTVRVGMLIAALLGAMPGATWAKAAEPEVGAMAPTPQPLGLHKGEPLLLESLRGRVVVVTFWATWCGPCLKELPILDALQRQVSPERLTVLAVNIENSDVFRRVQRTLGDKLALKVLHDRSGAAFTAYGKGGIPYLLVIDTEGRIDARFRGYGEETLDHILARVNALLAQPKTPL